LQTPRPTWARGLKQGQHAVLSDLQLFAPVWRVD
jgi:hypothetical protein